MLEKPVWLCFVLMIVVGVSAEELAPPLCFHASFDGTLEAAARGEGKPVKVEGPVEYRLGKVGQALLCGDGGATVFYATAGNLRHAAGTVEMWVCPLDWTGEKDTFHVFLEALNPGWLVFYRYYQGGLAMVLGSDPRTYRAVVGPSFVWQPGEWHHIAGTWRAQGLEVYVDGQRAGFAPNPPMPERLADTFRLGDHPWHVPRQEQTLIEEVKLYSAPLDAESIACAARGEPVRFKPQILVGLTPHPDTARLEVVCDVAGLVGDAGAGRRGRVELAAKGQEKAVEAAEIQAFPNDVGRVELPLEGLAEGEYEVRVAVVDEAGAAVAQTTKPFTKPGPPVWSGNTLGLEDEVLPPWTPLQLRISDLGSRHGNRAGNASAVQVECWGRRYEFGSFLSRVQSQGTELLAEPVWLEAVLDGQAVAATGLACQLEQASETKATLTGLATLPGLNVSVRHQIEYDGFTWTDLTVEPTAEVRLEELRLTWSLPADQATLLHADSMSWINNVAGRLKPEGWSSDFLHFFWLGNEERGLAWFAESDRFWHPSKEKPTIQVRRQGERVEVMVRLVAEPISLKSKVQYGFGLMATPVRPWPRGARRWRMAPGVRPTFEIIWPNGNMKYYGYPEPLDPEQFASRVQAAHERGCLIVPYVNLNFISAGVPEWQYYGQRWADPARVVMPSDVAAMGYASMGTCPNVRDWQDFILYRINEMIDRYQVDGIYVDCWGPSRCKVGLCAWMDEDGVVQGTHPIRAYRQILKRVYALFRKKRPNPLLMVHMSSEVDIPMLSFTDTILDGEQFQSGDLRDDYLDLLPPDKFRAEFMGRNWGPVAFFLPEFRNDYTVTGTPNLAAYLLLHDVNAWPIWSDVSQWNRLYDALDAFGIEEAEFLPYWKGSGTQSAEEILISAYVRPGKALLAVMNTGEVTEAKVTMDLARLGLAQVAAATDVLRGEPLRVEGATLFVPLERRQGRVVEVREARAGREGS